MDAYVPLSFAPGEAYQFAWSHEIVLLAGTTVTMKVAHRVFGDAKMTTALLERLITIATSSRPATRVGA